MYEFCRVRFLLDAAVHIKKVCFGREEEGRLCQGVHLVVYLFTNHELSTFLLLSVCCRC